MAERPPGRGKKIDNWSLTSLQQRLVKTGGRLVKHARYYWLLLAEGHLTRRLFGAILRRIWALLPLLREEADLARSKNKSIYTVQGRFLQSVFLM
jgi:hypothetical protein